MTESTRPTSARIHAKSAATKAKEAAQEGATAAQEAAESASDTIRTETKRRFTAVRNNDEVRNAMQGTREFLRKAEDPALLLATAVNPAIGLGAAGVVKGSRMLARGLRQEAAKTSAESNSTTTTTPSE